VLLTTGPDACVRHPIYAGDFRTPWQYIDERAPGRRLLRSRARRCLHADHSNASKQASIHRRIMTWCRLSTTLWSVASRCRPSIRLSKTGRTTAAMKSEPSFGNPSPRHTAKSGVAHVAESHTPASTWWRAPSEWWPTSWTGRSGRAVGPPFDQRAIPAPKGGSVGTVRR